MDSILDLLEPMLFALDAKATVRPLNDTASRCLASLPADVPVFRALFGISTLDALRDERTRVVAVPRASGSTSDVKWNVVDTDDGAMAVGIEWLTTDALAERVARETLIAKRRLLNVMPPTLVASLADRRIVQPKAYRDSTLMFVDAVDFSHLAAVQDPVSLLKQLDFHFSMFDRIALSHGLEKIATVGDAYLAAAGIPYRKPSHAVDAAMAALQVCASVKQAGRESRPSPSPAQPGGSVATEPWRFRIGLHTGACIAGVLGSGKYTFDIWGDAVRIAADVERVGLPDRVTVSDETRQRLDAWFVCTPAGETRPRHGDPTPVHTVDRLRPELSADDAGLLPNAAFARRYATDFHGFGQGNMSPPPPFVAGLMGR